MIFTYSEMSITNAEGEVIKYRIIFTADMYLVQVKYPTDRRYEDMISWYTLHQAIDSISRCLKRHTEGFAA